MSDAAKAYFERKTAHVAGTDVPLPIEYYDGSAAYFFYLVSSKKAAALLPDAFEPAAVVPGKAMLAICFYEYRKTSIGPYNELGIGLMVRPKGSRSVLGLDILKRPENRSTGFYVLQLPVTSEAANQAGRQIWGLPKFVADIPFTLTQSHVEASVADPTVPGQHLFKLRGDLVTGVTTKGIDLVLLNERAVLEKAVVTVSAKFQTSFCKNFSLEVGNGRHALSEALRELGVEGARPVMAHHTMAFAAKLYGPVTTR